VRGAVTGAARTASSVPGGSTLDSGTTPGGGVSGISVASHVTMAAFPWRWVAVAGAVLIVAAGLLAAWRGARWPVMSSRYDRPARRRPSPGTDPAALWEALSQGLDPTVSARGDDPPVPPVRRSAASGETDQPPGPNRPGISGAARSGLL
jgi:Tryptophan-associated transmembrane protein (Trp_oprn_chp)